MFCSAGSCSGEHPNVILMCYFLCSVCLRPWVIWVAGRYIGFNIGEALVSFFGLLGFGLSEWRGEGERWELPGTKYIQWNSRSFMTRAGSEVLRHVFKPIPVAGGLKERERVKCQRCHRAEPSRVDPSQRATTIEEKSARAELIVAFFVSAELTAHKSLESSESSMIKVGLA